MKVTPKGVIAGTGIVLIWIGACYASVWMGGKIGEAIGGVASKATDRLVKFATTK